MGDLPDNVDFFNNGSPFSYMDSYFEKGNKGKGVRPTVNPPLASNTDGRPHPGNEITILCTNALVGPCFPIAWYPKKGSVSQPICLNRGFD